MNKAENRAEHYGHAATIATIATTNLDFDFDFDEWTDAFAVKRLLASATIDQPHAYGLELEGHPIRPCVSLLLC